MNDFEEIYKIVKENESKGCVTFLCFHGLTSTPINEFVKQPAEGLLYDLNRDKATTLRTGKDGNVRWLNDYAMALVVEYLMKQINTSNE
jgi:hypothetical protein